VTDGLQFWLVTWRLVAALISAVLAGGSVLAAPPPSLQVSGVPDLPPELTDTLRHYDAAKSSEFMGWDPAHPYMLVS
jgi:hypothetical protein